VLSIVCAFTGQNTTLKTVRHSQAQTVSFQQVILRKKFSCRVIFLRHRHLRIFTICFLVFQFDSVVGYFLYSFYQMEICQEIDGGWIWLHPVLNCELLFRSLIQLRFVEKQCIVYPRWINVFQSVSKWNRLNTFHMCGTLYKKIV